MNTFSVGYEVDPGDRNCSVPKAFLVFSRDGDLHRISLNRTTTNDVIPVSKVKAASAIDFDTVERRIYWSDTKLKTISRAFMNGSDTEKVCFHVKSVEIIQWVTCNSLFFQLCIIDY